MKPQCLLIRLHRSINSGCPTGVNTKDANLEYTFYPARNSSYIRFKVKAKNDAHVMMSEYANPTDSQHYYEVRVHQTLGEKNSVATSKITLQTCFKFYFTK